MRRMDTSRFASRDWCYSEMGIRIPKTLGIWASPSQITLGVWVGVRVRVTRDAHITRLLGMGCPYHCDIGREMYLPYRKSSPKRSKETHS